jgi:WD40 repeat protein
VVSVAVVTRAALLAAATGVAACSGVGSVPFDTPPASIGALPPCGAPAVVPPLDEPRFAPHVAGEMSLVRAEGDARLSAEGGILAAWSPDGETVAFTDHGAVTVWRSKDGKLIDLVRCARGDLSANDIALSPSGRWVVVSGILRGAYGGGRDDRDQICIVDRKTGSARLVAGVIKHMTFARDERAVYGDLRALDLATGVVRPSPEVPGARARTGGHGSSVAVSNDGRRIARWSRCQSVDLSATTAPAQRSTPGARDDDDFLEVTDRETGKLLWRTNNPGGCYEWRFSPDDRFLEKQSNYAGDEIVDALTGARTQFPGGLLEITADGKRVIVLTATGPELWSVGPAAPIVGGKRYRMPIARSRDGTSVAVADRGRLAIEHGDRCFPLYSLSARDLTFFSPDDSEVYAGLDNGNTMSFMIWRADTGALTSALYVARRLQIYPMPAVGRVGIAAEGGIRIYDAHTHAPVGVARAPRTRYTPFNAEGRSWPVRDHDGDRPDELSSFVAATADGRHIVGTTGLGDPTVTIWDLDNPRGVIDLRVADRIERVVLSPDERFIAAGDGLGALSLWDRSGRTIPVAASHDTPPLALAFAPRGDRLAAAFADGTVDVIDTATGRTTGTVTLPSQRATFLWWSPDGKRLVIDSTRHLRFEVARP